MGEKKDRIYAPTDWDRKEFEPGTGTWMHMVSIAAESETRIAYNRTAHSVEVIGTDINRVFEARRKLEELFAPVIVRSVRPWERPNRPGAWGQRRDNLPPGAPERNREDAPRMMHGAGARPMGGGLRANRDMSPSAAGMAAAPARNEWSPPSQSAPKKTRQPTDWDRCDSEEPEEGTNGRGEEAWETVGKEGVRKHPFGF
ncbi:hypothetical protein HK097_006691 [Rhizophlyctis rosea]|uniref:Uncharacterized protein n=1 Tax=Rhizophlyctis rosea TaxID=64517 RepID=A0AAD5SKF8_9FUNG|nr:hypothetical protein HK097_006691 [Rhizophlyctis rosea]